MPVRLAPPTHERLDLAVRADGRKRKSAARSGPTHARHSDARFQTESVPLLSPSKPRLGTSVPAAWSGELDLRIANNGKGRESGLQHRGLLQHKAWRICQKIVRSLTIS